MKTTTNYVMQPCCRFQYFDAINLSYVIQYKVTNHAKQQHDIIGHAFGKLVKQNAF